MGVIKYDVVLFGLPTTPTHGHEVVVTFESSSIKNNGKFYTDSNGLGMQERILNYRPSYNVSIADGGLNITANYYPVVSAIAIRDPVTNKSMTVMNDRSQGGSSLADGRIELMQNRRLFVDDARGVNQPLNECNYKQVGITVPATYFMQIVFGNDQADASLQRIVQQRVDQPPQQFFSFDSTFASAQQISPVVSQGFEAAYASAGINKRMKVETLFNGRNSVLLRIENLADYFDTRSGSTSSAVNVQTLAEQLFIFANKNQVTTADFSLTIEELSLTANQPIATMQANKIQWKTVDDAILGKRSEIKDPESPSIVYLHEQSIRVFRVDYTSNSSSFLMY